jgi:predicted aspartyl protease
VNGRRYHDRATAIGQCGNLIAALTYLLLFATIGASNARAMSDAASLKALMQRQGFAGAPLQRRFGNHLYVTTIINNRRTALLVDTGSPYTLIDRSSATSLALPVLRTRARVGGVFGWRAERFGESKIRTLAMGNCTFSNVPVAVADESDINAIRGAHLDGLFGAHEMKLFGMVIDCARQMLYVNPRGSSSAASQQLDGYLRARGFTRVPMRESADEHFTVEAAINGRATRLIIDTGASTTLLASHVATFASVTPLPLHSTYRGSAGNVPIRGGLVSDLTIGGYQLRDAEVTIASLLKDLGAGLLGEDYLSLNFAVIDISGMALYLRHPDPD